MRTKRCMECGAIFSLPRVSWRGGGSGLCLDCWAKQWNEAHPLLPVEECALELSALNLCLGRLFFRNGKLRIGRQGTGEESRKRKRRISRRVLKIEKPKTEYVK